MDDSLIEFGKWVKKGMELIDKDLPLGDFLYKLERLMNGKNYLEKILLNHLLNIEKENIKQVTDGHFFANINSLIEELRTNILLRNYFSIFYNVELLAERIVDLIIRKGKDAIDESKRQEIERDMENGYFALQDKINLLKEIHEKYNTKDMEILIKIMELLQRIRNKFMFHIINYDDYQFVFDKDVWKKDEFLKRKILKSVLGEIVSLQEIIKGGAFENPLAKNLLAFYNQSWTKLCEFYDREKSSEESIILNVDIYGHLPKNFAEISYIFILFFGKSNLSLFR